MSVKLNLGVGRTGYGYINKASLKRNILLTFEGKEQL